MSDQTKQDNDDSKSHTNDGLDCPLCAKMGPKEVYKKWGFDYEARYKDTCKAHRPLMLERMEDGLKKLKELLAD